MASASHLSGPTTINEFGQEIGYPVPDWKPAERPDGLYLEGRYCLLQPLDVALHAQQLFDHFAADTEGKDWTYLQYGPFATLEDFVRWVNATCFGGQNLAFFAVVNSKTKETVGMFSYLRIEPNLGSIEIGHDHFSPAMQKTPISNED